MVSQSADSANSNTAPPACYIWPSIETRTCLKKDR
jgi:hypothetical protein